MPLDPVTQVSGRAVFIPGADIDTDRIIPARFMKCVTFDGLGEFAFYDVRFDSETGEKTDHPLNDPRFEGASILLAGENFGCGSSREHAPWALDDYGFRAVIAPSYADIFFNNCFKNGLLPVILSESEVDQLFHAVAAFPGFEAIIDLPRQVVTSVDGSLAFGFQIDPFRKDCLLNGWDDIGLVLRHADRIREFESRRMHEQPWLGKTLAG